jgi:hypothetical protein
MNHDLTTPNGFDARPDAASPEEARPDLPAEPYAAPSVTVIGSTVGLTGNVGECLGIGCS